MNRCAENGGFDLSDSDGMNAMECFPHISKLIVASVDTMSDPKYNMIKERFKQFDRVAEALFNWGKTLKSQKKVNLVNFTDMMLHWHAKWDESFPNIPYFPKLYDGFQYPPFVQKMSFADVLWTRVLNQAA